jgi:uncharacterized protein
MVATEGIQNLVDEIARLARPERVILFGSHASGTAYEHSDVDLMIVMDYQGTAIDRAMEIWNAVRPAFPVDLILRRPGELEEEYRLFDPLARAAVDGGRILYERNRAPVVH